jgi:MiaB/RimO family radical SAM methylthiotransferase
LESRLDVWNKNTYTIRISTGCLGNCSYCSIKQARGKISSRPIQTIVSEVKDGLELGYHDYALIGTDIGDYGKDLETNLLELLKAIISIPGRFQLRLRNVNPRWLVPNVDALCEILKSGKIGYIQSPIQSGSNRILKLMKRGYLAGDYLNAMERIRKSSTEVFLKTQLIVGFPTESEEDFLDSLRLYDPGLFNYIEVFSYSSRPNTKASMMSGQLPEQVIWRRYKKLLVKSNFQLAPKQLLLQLLTPSKSVN